MPWLLATIVCVSAAAADSSDGPGDLLQRARQNREVLSADFPGFESRLRIHVDGSVHVGSMRFQPPIVLEVDIADTEVRKQVKRTIRSLLAHRLPQAASSQESTRFAELDRHPLGRRIVLGDKYDSSYRIRDDQILEVDRRMADGRLVITVLSTEETDSGRYLPTSFFVTMFDRESGAVQSASAYSDSYQLVSGNYLPLSRQIVTGKDGHTEALLVEWADMKLLPPRDDK